ncbi:MAG: hypothetical protein LKF87_10740 [Clostridium tyrobutyricum]|jgi:hypothetical protein|uniref:hypothetical protein n=1 Tax=Clostridium tyrobutyricum TaxID=1519 RepID=UPI0018AAE67D|nr:hypothetical protein [Clostridium tyrobutyricum]MCH4201203.1 hypothetical protein [Clostridium tyrobutyricum]MCH4237763.1 hypothetical protein [Clostridium tyrobutyricum]MCH4259420.1 hypothetical protein [Clostridium tyrobutyricum]MCI1653689.1 hypothetical protein [Clostridium tyrobutyricum]MCI1937829.1 hypothetical protein [Clostridium tyrobutyricum]
MFEKVHKNRGLRVCNSIGKQLLGKTVKIPIKIDLNIAKEELNSRLSGEGLVRNYYSINTFIGYKYAEDHFHYLTGNLMLDDINKGKKIYLNSYI